MDINKLYIQLRDGCQGEQDTIVLIKDLAVVLSDSKIKEEILRQEILFLGKNIQEYTVVSVLTIIDKITNLYPNMTIIPIGSSEILVHKKNKKSKDKNLLWTMFKLVLVCITLFVGTGLAIMNFHADVNMAESHKQIYKLLTGIENSRPLIIQIPYSLGIGLGMAIFFSHIIPKKYSNEPSPMEIEMYSYKKSINEYLLKNEKNTEEDN